MSNIRRLLKNMKDGNDIPREWIISALAEYDTLRKELDDANRAIVEANSCFFHHDLARKYLQEHPEITL
jgi:hypothetical protein